MDSTVQAAKDALQKILQARQKQTGGASAGASEEDPRLKRPSSSNADNDSSDEHNNSSSEEDNASDGNNSSELSDADDLFDDNETPRSPQIGDRGDEKIQEAEEAVRKAQEYAENAQDIANGKAAQRDDDLKSDAQDLADKAQQIADNAQSLKKDLKKSVENSSEEDNKGSSGSTRPLDSSADAELQARIEKIQADLHNVQLQQQAVMETQNAVLASQQREAEKRNKRIFKETSRPAGAQAFIDSIKTFIRNVTHPERVASWKRPSKKESPGGLLTKGRARNNNILIPSIDVYFDRSGSWDDHKIELGKQAVSLLMTLEKKRLIKVRVFYFGDALSTNPDDPALGVGTSATQKILDNIRVTHADNVIIMTDSDMDTQGEFTNPVSVQGTVWFVFCGGVCHSIMEYLHGRKGNKVFILNENGK